MTGPLEIGAGFRSGVRINPTLADFVVKNSTSPHTKILNNSLISHQKSNKTNNLHIFPTVKSDPFRAEPFSVTLPSCPPFAEIV